MTNSNHNHHKANIAVFQTILRLKEILRQGWIGKVSLADIESVADHSVSVSLLAVLLVPLENELRKNNKNKLDKAVVLEKALLHDIGEGNYFDIDNSIKTILGKEEASEVKNKLDSAAESKFIENYKALQDLVLNEHKINLNFYNSQKDSEVDLFVKFLDQFELYLQTKRYLSNGFLSGAQAKPFLHQCVKQILELKEKFQLIQSMQELGFFE